MVEQVVKKDVEDLQAAFKQVQADLATLTRVIGDLTTHGAQEGLAEVLQARDSAQVHLRKAAEEARTLGQSGVSLIEREVKEQPVMAVLIAFGVGWVLGKLADRA